MQKRSKVIVISGAVLLAVGIGAIAAAPSIYRNLMATPEVAPPTLQADTSAVASGNGELLDPTALSGTWKVLSDSTVGYRVDEQLQGSPVTVVGQTNSVTGSLEVTDLTLNSAEITVDVATLQTDNQSRDNYFRETTIRADEFPTATFKLTTPITLPAAPVTGEIFTQQLTGTLTMAGVTNQVTLTAQARSDGTKAEIVGKIPVTFSEFGITAPSLGGFVVVEDTGLIEFDILAERSNS